MEDTASMTLGKRILYHRKRLGLTQDQLAAKMGVTAQAVSKWEHDLSCPDVTALPRLAELFGITTDELLGTRPPEAAKVHTGEVETKSHDDGWSWEFHWDRDGVLFALFLVALGAAYIAVTLLKLQVSFWSLLWPMGFIYVGLSSCLKRFSAFGGGAIAAGVYFLLVNLGVIPSLITWPVILGALLVLWGISMILDQTRRRKRKTLLRSGHSENQPRRGYNLREGYADVDIAFCSDNIHVQAPELRGGKVDLAFGSLILDLGDCAALAPGCCLKLDAAFSSLVLQVPGCYRVDLELERTGASLDISGTPAPTPEATLRLTGDCSFGSLKIQYI